jgi:hypothetical protein
MANYYATARSNYFAVKDEQAFRDWANGLSLIILEPDHSDKTADSIPRFGITPGDNDSGGWPTSLSDETGDYEDIDVADQLTAHLADDEVAILIEAGSEKLRYIVGWADAVNNKGEHIILALESIYEAARTLGSNITRAEY